MSELQFEWQLDEQRTDELGILAKSLNYLSQKLNVTLNDLQAANRKLELDIEHEKALEQARTNFFSAVSHELKTPITIIKGQLEGMLLGIGPYKDHERYLTRSLEITNTLARYIDNFAVRNCGGRFQERPLGLCANYQSLFERNSGFDCRKRFTNTP